MTLVAHLTFHVSKLKLVHVDKKKKDQNMLPPRIQPH
jgi:hypothetical protein